MRINIVVCKITCPQEDIGSCDLMKNGLAINFRSLIMQAYTVQGPQNTRGILRSTSRHTSTLHVIPDKGARMSSP